MKMHNNQKFQVAGSEWRFEKGANPQGTMIGTAKDGENLATIIPKDWSKPISAAGNAMLITRSSMGNDWKPNAPTDLKQALKQGADHIRGYHQDRQVQRVEAYLNDPMREQHAAPKRVISSANDRQQKPLKGRAAIRAMQAATELFQDGAENRAQRQTKEQGMSE